MGYVYVKSEIKELIKKNGYAKMANVIWFKHTGEIIKKPYLLHHIDGDKQNDSITNLKKVTRSEHIKIHLGENKKLTNVERP